MGRVLRGRVALAIVALTAVGLGVASCSSDAAEENESPLRVELIGEAIAAVESTLGGPQEYFEVNATPTIVNLFVATDDATQAVAYVFIGGELEDPAAPMPASGPTFTFADVDFDVDRVLTQVTEQLPSSEFRLFSVTAAEAGGAQYRVVVNSTQGTEFVVFVSSTGAVLGTDQNLGIGES